MKTNEIQDVFGKAIRDFYAGIESVIITFSTLGGKDEFPVSYLFRDFGEMPRIEQAAMDLARGNILDVGCGAGCHALYLQQKGLSVKPIDISEGAIEVCKLRGLHMAEQLDLWDLKQGQFDTILCLMNGTGICGSMDRVPFFLKHLKSLLSPGGQILIDSTDVIYMYEDEQGQEMLSEITHYYGEAKFEMKYQEASSGTFNWLYLDFNNLKQQAGLVNLTCELILKGSDSNYLARLSPM
jgi:SAM-dependent methyltransferase